MAKDLLLEIGVEEMPAPFMSPALAELKILTEKILLEKRIDYTSVRTLGTPRRLVLHVEGVAETQHDAIMENRGPKKEAAFDKEGQPSKAAQGFARGQGIDVSELQIREVAGVEYVFAIKTGNGWNDGRFTACHSTGCNLLPCPFPNLCAGRTIRPNLVGRYGGCWPIMERRYCLCRSKMWQLRILRWAIVSFLPDPLK